MGADLLTIGKRLDQVGTQEFSWWDLSVRVMFAQPDSIIYKAIHGHTYGMVERQLGIVIDTLRAANWQRSGGRGPRPKPVRWPWSPKSGDDRTVGTAAPLDDVRAFLLAKNGRSPER